MHISRIKQMQDTNHIGKVRRQRLSSFCFRVLRPQQSRSKHPSRLCLDHPEELCPSLDRLEPAMKADLNDCRENLPITRPTSTIARRKRRGERRYKGSNGINSGGHDHLARDMTAVVLSCHGLIEPERNALHPYLTSDHPSVSARTKDKSNITNKGQLGLRLHRQMVYLCLWGLCVSRFSRNTHGLEEPHMFVLGSSSPLSPKSTKLDTFR